MTLSSLRRWFTSPRRISSQQRTYRPRLQMLDERLVPATFTVTTGLDVVNPTDGKLSLREAISRANATTERDTIVLSGGTFRIGLTGANENGNATGDFDITNPVTIVGQGSASTAIDGAKLDRVFDVLNTIDVTLSGVTVRNGATALKGGGIQSNTANLRLVNCVVSGNSASQTGGGLHADGGTINLVGTVVSRNVAVGNGGGINVGAGNQLTLLRSSVLSNFSAVSGGGISGFTVTVLNSRVNNNSAAGLGGGIVANTLTLNGSTISANSAVDEGGGIYASFPNVLNSTISNNVSRSSGGGISVFNDGIFLNSTISNNTAYVNGGGVNGSDATLTNCTINDNNAFQHGGGIALNYAALTNVTTSSNNAAQRGGGLYLGRGTITNCTVTLNNAFNTAGGVYIFGNSLLNIVNTIVAQNSVSYAGTNHDVSGNFTSLGHNLIGDGTGSTGFTNAVNGDQVGTAQNQIDAKLGALAFNGGRTKTHALRAGSPAIDAGDNKVTVTTDQRGRTRRKDGDGNGNAIVDIGAVER